MKTEVVSAQECAKAVELLRAGEIVALPTETVYGLAANALDPIAVAKIFEAKERPHFDPLIIHIPDQGWLEQVADIPTQDRQLVLRLVGQFWPGPFTLVLPKKSIVPDIATAGLGTVAVRMSAHAVFAGIVGTFGKPLAAPSANLFGRTSPTTASHVLDELDGRIPMIVDGGSTEHGLESTIVAVQADVIQVLRRGPVTDEQLSAFGKIRSASQGDPISAPGQLPSHYAPRKPLRLVEDVSQSAGRNLGLLAWNLPARKDFAAVRVLSERQDLREAAANLFRYLRDLDAMENVHVIVAERVPNEGLGAAIMDRLSRADNARFTESSPG